MEENVKILPAKFPLTKRQHDVVVLSAKGLTMKEIAEKLKLSERTVDEHLQRARMKLGAVNTNNLIALFFIYYPNAANRIYNDITKAAERMQRSPSANQIYTWG